MASLHARSGIVHHIRVLLAVRPLLLRDALHVLLTQHTGLTVVDAEPRNVEILVGAQRHQVDVVVATLEPTTDMAPLVTHLLAEFPEIRVVGISVAENYARIYCNGAKVRRISRVTAADILKAIFDVM